MLYAIIITFGSVSGVHFNPAVTRADATLGGRRWRTVPGYLAAQLSGGAMAVLTVRELFPSASRYPTGGAR